MTVKHVPQHSPCAHGSLRGNSHVHVCRSHTRLVSTAMSLYTSLGVSPRKRRVAASSDDESTPKRPRVAYVVFCLPVPVSPPTGHPPRPAPHAPSQDTSPDSTASTPHSSTPSPMPSQRAPCPPQSRPASSATSSTTSPSPPTRVSPPSSTRPISSASAGSGSGTLPLSHPHLPRMIPTHSSSLLFLSQRTGPVARWASSSAPPPTTQSPPENASPYTASASRSRWTSTRA